MTLPRKVVGILGMVQVLFVAYSVLVADFFLADRAPGDTALVHAFRNYGALLFLVPLCWTVLSAYYSGKSEPPLRVTPLVVVSWAAITALLLACDVVLTAHLISRHAWVKV